MEEWIQFVQERWLIILIALIAIIIVLKVVKAVVKWVLIIAIILGIGYYGMNYTDQIKAVSVQVMDYAKEQAFQAMIGESSDAKYQFNQDGSYEVESANITITGQLDSDVVTVTFKGQSFNFTINETIQGYIEAAKRNVDK